MILDTNALSALVEGEATRRLSLLQGRAKFEAQELPYQILQRASADRTIASFAWHEKAA